MDEQQRADWRARLERAHGRWLCATCKTAYAAQDQFEQMEGVVDITRHSECGHVLCWRDGGTDWLAPYLAEPMMPVALPAPPPLPRGSRRWKS